MYSINMQNLQQNSEIMYINNEINLLQDLHKKNEKSQNQFQNGLVRIVKIRVKKGQRTNFSQTKKIQNIVRNIFENKIKQIIKILVHYKIQNVKKERDYLKKD